MKACVDCAHYRPPWASKSGFVFDACCTRPVNAWDRVKGHTVVTFHSPYKERATVRRCGPKARYFKSKPPTLWQRFKAYMRFWSENPRGRGGAECTSCKNGYNGRNGNGYQPCGCKPPNA